MAAIDVNESLTLAARVDEVQFPEFTAKLITDTMDAIVASTIRQQEGYAELVERLTKDIAVFEFDEVSSFEVDRWLAETFPDPDAASKENVSDMTIIRAGLEYTPQETDEEGNIIVAEDPPIMNLLANEFDELGLDDLTTPLTEDDVNNIKRAVRRKLAKSRKSVLERLLEIGYARIVITDGKVYSRLVFRTEGSSFREKIQREYERKSWRIGGRAGIFGSFFGIGVGGGIRSLKVKAVNERTTDWASLRVDITGGVEINFHTDYTALS